ncbi:MAG TPA: polyprenol monophosphomannose synthase [Bacteroidia bacterium]|jgi:dolichol-phosphate mannosyltransferase|nr:polyprenol monophosphomannose synthase [Bacteroidia bacterium]
MLQDSLVIIPTYNEKGNIENITRKVMSLLGDFHVLIIDDSSPDGTGDIVKSLIKEFPGRLFIEERKGKLGLGTAYIAGFKWALAKGYEYIFEMDADFSHNPDDLIRLKEACVNGADMAIGSRYVKGGKIENWPTNRLVMSYGASLYVRFILWINVKDTTAGFKCYRRRVLEAIPLDEIKFVGYAFQIEMKYRAARKGFKIAEVPVTFIDRRVGVSKMSTKIFKEAFWGVLQMRFARYGK